MLCLCFYSASALKWRDEGLTRRVGGFFGFLFICCHMPCPCPLSHHCTVYWLSSPVLCWIHDEFAFFISSVSLFFLKCHWMLSYFSNIYIYIPSHLCYSFMFPGFDSLLVTSLIIVDYLCLMLPTCALTHTMDYDCWIAHNKEVLLNEWSPSQSELNKCMYIDVYWKA